MSKTGPNEMRILLERMRGGKNKTPGALTEVKKVVNPTMRDMLKITRGINEQIEGEQPQAKEPRINMKNSFDQTREEDRFRQFFDNMNVNIQFVELEVFPDLIFFGGTIDNMLQFVYKVTPDEGTSGVEFNYLDSFDRNNPDNQKIIEMVESYFSSFYKYWRDNVLDV